MRAFVAIRFRAPRRAGPIVLLGLLLSCSNLPSDSVSDAEREAARGAPTVNDIGTSTFAVTTQDEEARRLFHQGLQLDYAFEQGDAARAFRAAFARDATCAMCAWGVAYALGPNINAPDRRNEPEIRKYLRRARAAAPNTTPVEQALIHALALRYGDVESAQQRAAAARAEAMCSTASDVREVQPLERAYAQAMKEVVERFPHDPDVVTLYADAVLLTTSGRWGDPKIGAPGGDIGILVDRLQAALKQNPEHVGLTHFLIHAAEQAPHPERAETAADQLGKLAPGAPHLVHMPSHIYVLVGRFSDATRVNEQALEVQRTYNDQITKAGFTLGQNWDFHHLHFLWYAALMEGRGDLALDTARRLAERVTAATSAEVREYGRALPLHTLVRFERWDQILAEPKPEPGLGLTEGIWEYARGMAFAHTGRLAEAQESAHNLAQSRQRSTVGRARLMGRALPDELLRISAALLDGAIAFAPDGASTPASRGAAIAELEAAAQLEDDIGGEPPRWAMSARLALADALLVDGRAADAEREFREHLRRQPDNGWAMRGLRQALAAQGRTAEAEALDKRLHVAWAQADAGLLVVR